MPTYESRESLERLLHDVESRTDLPAGARDVLRAQTAKRLRNARAHQGGDKTLALRFVQMDQPSYHALPTTFLATALRDLQSSLDYVVWAEEAGPNVHGDVPTSIARSAATEVVAIESGSFKITVRKVEPEIADSFDRGVELVLDLMDSADENSFGEEVENFVRRLGSEATIRLERFFKRIGRAGTSLDVEWRSDIQRQTYLSARQAVMLADWLGDASPDEEVVPVTGVLKMAASDAGRFKLVDPVTEAVYEGRSDVPLAHVELDATYLAQVRVRTSTVRVTGEKRHRMTLVDLVRKF